MNGMEEEGAQSQCTYGLSVSVQQIQQQPGEGVCGAEELRLRMRCADVRHKDKGYKYSSVSARRRALQQSRV